LRVFAAAVLALTSFSAGADSIGEPAVDRLEHEISNWTNTIVASGATPAVAVAVVRRGENDVLIATGDTATRAGQSIDAHTVFRLASLSKGFSGTLTALLAEAGYLSLNDSVADRVPGLTLKDPSAATALTIERLLSHQTGLPHHTFDMKLEANAALADLLQALPTIKPNCAIGTCYAYQNVIFNVAADVAFNSAGSFFEMELRRRLLVPLNMADTSVGRENLLSEDNWARPHVHTGSGWVPVEPKPTYYQLPAAAGVNASIADVATWMRAQLGEYPEVISSEVLETVHSARIETPGELLGPRWRRERLSSAGYALGWRIFDYAGTRVVFHAGAVQGYRAMLALVPDRGSGFAILWNSNSGVPAGMLPTLLDRELDIGPTDWLQLDVLQLAAQRQQARKARVARR
jgi:beta-lactamase class C